jgi:hypothetical protein
MTRTSNIPSSRPHIAERPPHALSGLAVVLPCPDEAANLCDAVRDATMAAERCALTHEIVCAAGARIAEVPVHHRARIAGRQTGSGPRLGARTLRDLADRRHPQRDRPARATGA